LALTLALALALALASAVAPLVIFSALKASRAPQLQMAEEVRVSERSEFPRRAVCSEARRAPMRSIGERRALRFWLLLPSTKVARGAKRRESLVFGETAAKQYRPTSRNC
jgi:hypothetical protein